MENLPEWFRAAISQRVDTIGRQMQAKGKMEGSADGLAKLQASLSEEQRELFVDWEDQVGLRESGKKAEMYIHGLLDGFQLHAFLEAKADFVARPEQEPALPHEQGGIGTPAESS